MPFSFTKTPIPGLIIVEPKVFADNRGWFMESYKSSEFISHGIKEDFVQDNHSRSTLHVLRGLHFQKAPHAQGKLVRCTLGEVWDVAVDLRSGSATFGEYYSLSLSHSNNYMLYIPPGFAHGFVTLSETAEVQYKCTSEYDPDSDGGIRFDDERIGIEWPINIEKVLVSEKDRKLPTLTDLGENFAL